MSQYKPIRVRFFIIAVVASILLGLSILPAIDKGNELWQQHLYRRELVTNPAYRVNADVESYNSRVTVLNVTEEDDGPVVMWLIHNELGITQEEWIPYLVDTLAHLFEALLDVYPNRPAYVLAFAQAIDVNTIEGVKTGIVSRGIYVMPSHAVSMFLSEPTIESLDFLYGQGLLMFRRVSVSLADVLPREPRFIWPWE